MLRIKLILAGAALLAAALPAAASARRPLIKGEEIGYFGSATVTHRVEVFVYSNLGPRAGNRITVCLRGRCEHARGHNAHLAWYSASFSSRGLRMGDPVTFTVLAADGGAQVRTQVTRPLFCMHNNGSTPQH